MPTTYYEWDPVDDVIVAEYDESGETIAEYTHEPGLHGRMISQVRNGEADYYHHDASGNTVAISNESGDVTDTYQYSAFGEDKGHSGSAVNPFRYNGNVGYYYDTLTNSYYVRARHLVPSRGRWLSADSLGVRAREVNLYLYVLNSPTNRADPSGLDWTWNPLEWWKYFSCYQSAKNLYDCRAFTEQFNELEKTCEDETADFNGVAQWAQKCPDQISPIVNTSSVRHAQLCCILHKAHASSTIDYDKFTEGFVACVKSLRLSLDIVKLVIPGLPKGP